MNKVESSCDKEVAERLRHEYAPHNEDDSETTVLVTHDSVSSYEVVIVRDDPFLYVISQSEFDRLKSLEDSRNSPSLEMLRFKNISTTLPYLPSTVLLPAGWAIGSYSDSMVLFVVVTVLASMMVLSIPFFKNWLDHNSGKLAGKADLSQFYNVNNINENLILPFQIAFNMEKYSISHQASAMQIFESALKAVEIEGKFIGIGDGSKSDDIFYSSQHFIESISASNGINETYRLPTESLPGVWDKKVLESKEKEQYGSISLSVKTAQGLGNLNKWSHEDVITECQGGLYMDRLNLINPDSYNFMKDLSVHSEEYRIAKCIIRRILCDYTAQRGESVPANVYLHGEALNNSHSEATKAVNDSISHLDDMSFHSFITMYSRLYANCVYGPHFVSVFSSTKGPLLLIEKIIEALGEEKDDSIIEKSQSYFDISRSNHE